MIYNNKLINKNIDNYTKAITLLNLKKYFLYCLVVFLLSRINILFYMAPIGIAFTIVYSIKNNKTSSIIVSLASMLGYFSIRTKFVDYNLYLLINLIIILVKLLDFKTKTKQSVMFSLSFLSILLYRFIISGFSFRFSVFFTFIEIGVIFLLYFIFMNFMKVSKYFNNNSIFLYEEILCMVITICLCIVGFNNVQILGIKLVNVLLLVFILLMSYVNGMFTGIIAAIFSGVLISLMYGEFTEYIAIYSIIACITSLLYSSKRVVVVLVSLLCIMMLKFLDVFFIGINDGFLLVEIVISMIIFLSLSNRFLSKISVSFNEGNKREFYMEKRLFNTLDIRLQKINGFNNIIKNLSEMIVSNVNSKQRILDQKIYVEILAENVCAECNKVNTCWKNNFKTVRDELIISLDNFMNGNNELSLYINNICVRKENIKNELRKISSFYNMKKIYEEKIHEAQNILSCELKNVHNIIEQGVKEVKKDIVVKVNYEKNLINKFNDFNIKYLDLVCYEEKDKVKVKIIFSHNLYEQYKMDILSIVEMALNKKMVLQEEVIQYVNGNKEIILNYVERYNYNIISHCLQLSKDDKNGDNYLCVQSNNDDYIVILSDGIGSGLEAYEKSKFTVDLVYNFIKTGLDLPSCIKEIVSIISLKFFRDEAISTIDFARINLYNGEMDYLKISSVITYVKRDKEIFVIESDKEVFDENNDILTGKFNLKYGDVLVHLTDGLIHFKDLSHKAWLRTFLKNTNVVSPDKLCEEIIEEFKSLNKGRFQDDVTVIVSKIYKNFD